MNVNEVIKYPILTEKTYAQMANGVYTFAVDKQTNKAEVKKTVEFIFDVKVERVNILTVNRKAKKLGRFAGFTAGYKKAIVKLADGQINIFPEEAVAQAPVEAKAKKAKAPAKAEISEAEKKAAEKIAAKAKAKSVADKVIDTAKDLVETAKVETNEVINKAEEKVVEVAKAAVDAIKHEEKTVEPKKEEKTEKEEESK